MTDVTMQLRSLGSSNLKVSEVGFGCMSLHEDNQSNRKLLREAFESGINFFDTADLYDGGTNEVLVGNSLREIRRKVVLATKVGNQLRSDGSGWDWNPGYSYIKGAIEKSLKRLRTDYIDLYQLHGGTIEDPIDDTIQAFEELQKEGKIRYYGISSIRPNVIREYVKRSRISSVMLQYSLLDRRPEESVLDLLRDNDIGVLARGTLAKGMLAGKPSTEYMILKREEVEDVLNQIRKIAPEPLEVVAQTYVLSNNAVSSSVVGFRTQEQLMNIVRLLNGVRPTKDLVKILKQVLPELKYTDHR